MFGQDRKAGVSCDVSPGISVDISVEARTNAVPVSTPSGTSRSGLAVTMRHACLPVLADMQDPSCMR